MVHLGKSYLDNFNIELNDVEKSDIDSKIEPKVLNPRNNVTMNIGCMFKNMVIRDEVRRWLEE